MRLALSYCQESVKNTQAPCGILALAVHSAGMPHLQHEITQPSQDLNTETSSFLVMSLNERKRHGAVSPKGARKNTGARQRGRSGSRESHYQVIHHVPGLVRLSVPSLRRASLAELKALAKELKRELIPGKVLDVRANPLTGNVTLTYDAAELDILSWVDTLLLREDIARILGGDPS
jgi:hypothetical protein